MSFCSREPSHTEVPHIEYEEALLRISHVAQKTARFLSVRDDGHSKVFNSRRKVDDQHCSNSVITMPLLDAVGHTCATTIHAPICTPACDTSAMDGFAVCSQETMQASESCPVTLVVVDSIAAGDRPRDRLAAGPVTGVCVEIMTGAQFPEVSHPLLDAVVKVEDVITLEQQVDGHCKTRCIQIRRPAKPRQHRRPAGSDFLAGDLIIQTGMLVEPKHIAALASLNIPSILVRKTLERPVDDDVEESNVPVIRIAVLSTGSELLPVESMNRRQQAQNIADSNGPYMVASLRKATARARVDYLGIAADCEETLTESLRNAIKYGCDVLMTSGGVSKGRYDLIRRVIERDLGGNIMFHGVSVRPGAPILFATYQTDDLNDSRQRQIAIFGAPGNPLAAAMALKFFVIPYVQQLIALRRSLDSDLVVIEARKVCDCSCKYSSSSREDTALNTVTRRKPMHLTVFWLARECENDADHIKILDDQASYKLKNLLFADCWVVVPAGKSEVVIGDILSSLPL